MMCARKLRALLMLVACIAIAGLVTGCGDDGDGGSQESSDSGGSPATSNEKVKLRMWAWYAGIDEVVKQWNQENPNIQVSVDTSLNGDATIPKLIAAHKAGNAPDIYQFGYDWLPLYVTNGIADDLTEPFDSIKSEFTDDVLSQVTFAGKTFGVPQDIAPMMFFYRADLFKKYGLKVPTTWEEFAEEGRKLRDADPKRRIASFSASDASFIAGLAQQDGATWWKQESDGSWDVSLNDAPTQRVVTFWNDLVDDDVVTKDIRNWTPQFVSALNSGKLLSFSAGLWAPGAFAQNTPSTKGKWKAAPLPQWSAGDDTTGMWGGGGLGIDSDSKNKDAAFKFISWLNATQAGTKQLASTLGVYPAASIGQTSEALSEPPPFMAESQPDFFDLANEIAGTARGFSWGPNSSFMYNQFTDAFSNAITRETKFTDAMTTVNDAVVEDMEKNGFTVNK